MYSYCFLFMWLLSVFFFFMTKCKCNCDILGSNLSKKHRFKQRFFFNILLGANCTKTWGRTFLARLNYYNIKNLQSPLNVPVLFGYTSIYHYIELLRTWVDMGDILWNQFNLKICHVFTDFFYFKRSGEGLEITQLIILCKRHKFLTRKWLKITTNSVIRGSSFFFSKNPYTFWLSLWT